MKYELFLVGGTIRDELLGLKSKDIDYSVVITQTNVTNPETAFKLLSTKLSQEGYEVFLETPDCYTIRAMFPKDHKHSGVADFVMARKENGYIEGTRRPIIEIGTLEDDLLRRDFTINAMARNEYGTLVDLYNGLEDLNNKILQTPTDPLISFQDDPLRVLRGMRFAITKGFHLSKDVKEAIRELGIHGMEVVSEERIREELYKCLHFDTLKTLDYLNFLEDSLKYPIKSYIFETTRLWLKPTNEK